jgi:hypothetical protein
MLQLPVGGRRKTASSQLSQMQARRQDLHVDVALFSETHLKSHERFFIPNYNFYRMDRHPGRKGGTAATVRKAFLIIT